jgi:transposase
VIDLEHESNPERLRNVARLQHAQIRHLTSLLEKKEALLAKLTGTESNLALELAALAQSSATPSASTPAKPEDRRKPKADEKKPQTGHGPTAQPALEHVVMTCKLDVPDQICPSCGGALAELPGQFETSEVVDVVEVQYKVVQVQLQKYRCGCGACVDTALPSEEVPERNIAGGRYSLEFATKVAIDKYLHHLPLERQVRMMAQHQLHVGSQTLWDQLCALALCLEPTWNAVRDAILAQPVIGLDTTGWPNLEDRAAKKWQMWCLVAPGLVFHDIRDDKSAATFVELVGHFAGTAVTDQAATNTAGARDGPGGMRLSGCWAHIYRKFAEAEPDHPAASVMLGLIGELYAVERRATNDQERAELRRTESVAILARMKAWLEATPVIASTSLGAAIKHTTNVWPRLRVFVEDPNVWLDNNATERGLRGPVVGRRNHFGSKSRLGTKVAAILYSLIETAKASHVDPAKYLADAVRAARRGQVLLPGTKTVSAPA